MNLKDKLFRDISNNKEIDQRHFCHLGWEGTGSFAFIKFADAYFDSADVLFNKFKESAGDYAVLDGIGITICFLYRHSVELYLKYLYLDLVSESEEDFKYFLKKGHNLSELWNILKPKLNALEERVGSSVDIGALEHYIMQFHHFDLESMNMRYPVKKDLSPMNKRIKLDIFNLHECMIELKKGFYILDHDLSNQLFRHVEQEKIDEFLYRFNELSPRISWILNELKTEAEKEVYNYSSEHIFKIFTGEVKDIKIGLITSLPDDELIMLDALYYAGRAILCEELRLPKNPHEAEIDVTKYCILNMKRDRLEFGKQINDEISIYDKRSSSIIENVTRVIPILTVSK